MGCMEQDTMRCDAMRCDAGALGYPDPPLKCPPLVRVYPVGGDGRQVTVLPPRGGDCKGIYRQPLVPSTDAIKHNTSEATFALMLCQYDSCNMDVIGGPKGW